MLAHPLESKDRAGYLLVIEFAFPTKRRIFLRDERRPLKDRLVIQADLGNYELTY